MQVKPIGFDLAKPVFQVHGIDAGGRVAICRKLRWTEVISYFSQLSPVVVGMQFASLPRSALALSRRYRAA